MNFAALHYIHVFFKGASLVQLQFLLFVKNKKGISFTLNSGAHGVVVSHPLRMRKALGSNPSVSIVPVDGCPT